MTTRRELLVALGAGALTAPFGSFAQQPQRVYRIGFLFAGTLAQRPQAQGFWEGLRELGYDPGKNIVIEVREARGHFDLLPQLAVELVKMKPDVLVAVTTPAAMAAQHATRSIPIVMIVVSDPLGAGFTSSLARPSGNMTGVSNVNNDLAAKQLQLLRELVPSATRVAILFNPKNPQNLDVVNRVKSAALSLGAEIQPIPAQVPEDLGAALTSALQKRFDALIVVGDSLTFDHRREIIAFAAAHRIPAIHNYPEEALDGGLMSYGTNLAEHYRRAAPYVDRILKGAKPGDLPIEQPTKFELVLNMKTAKALGIKIPDSIMLRADKVIE